MNVRDRIGIDCGRKLSVEGAVQWAIDNEVRYIDCQIDVEPNALPSFDERRCAPIREKCVENDIHLGLHTLSASFVRSPPPIPWTSASRIPVAGYPGCELPDVLRTSAARSHTAKRVRFSWRSAYRSTASWMSRSMSAL